MDKTWLTLFPIILGSLGAYYIITGLRIVTSNILAMNLWELEYTLRPHQWATGALIEIGFIPDVMELLTELGWSTTEWGLISTTIATLAILTGGLLLIPIIIQWHKVRN